tara:strand:- start:288 stop:602 length:315 start_codon:yes stop_codon:yes gene_type:complete
MSNYWPLVLAAVAGLGLGTFFYVGLYFTVIRGLSSPHPALWFLSSFLLRISLVVTGLYFISDGYWQRILAGLVGFVVAGLVVRVWKNTPSAIKKATDKNSLPIF